MRFDNPFGDGKAQPKAFLFRGEKGVEDMRQSFERNALSSVSDGDLNVMVVFTHPNPQAAFGLRRVGHGIHAVQDQVQQHLLQMHTITLNGSEFAIPFRFDLNAAPRRFPACHLDNVSNQLGQVE